jgi:DNA-binding NarL/FixJ family response regulator
MAFEVALLEAEQPPRYQQIAEKAIHLNQLGLSNEAIARHLGVDGKTVAKALRWSMDKS